MYLKSKGVTLLEISIVMLIFGVVSIGVTNLSIKAIEQQRDQQTATYHNHLYNEMQQDLRNDFKAAFAVWVSSNGGAPAATTDYYISQACGGASPNTAAGTGNTLNIVKQVSYDPATPSVTFQYIRYQFVTVGSRKYLVKLVSANSTVADEPGNLWPKDVTNATSKSNHLAGFRSFTTIAAINLPSRVYNTPNITKEDNDITGVFKPIYGEECKPPVGSTTITNCSFYIKTIDLDNLTFTAAGYSNKYDKKFGKANLMAPTMSFEVSSSLKFF